MDDTGLLKLDHLAAPKAGNNSARCFRWNGIGSTKSIHGSCYSGEICCFMSDSTKKETRKRASILRELIGECNGSHAYNYNNKATPNLFIDDQVLPHGYMNGSLVDPFDDLFMYEEMTVQETLGFHNAMRKDAEENEANVYRLVKIMKLNGVLSQRINILTPDQRRCLTISIEIISGADVIIYDDFTSGLTSIQFADVLSNLKKMLCEFNPSCFIILGVARLSYDEIQYVDRIQVISNTNTGSSGSSIPTFAKQTGYISEAGGDNREGDRDRLGSIDESFFNGSCSLIKAYIRRCHSDSYIYSDSSQSNSREHDVGTSFDFISIDRTDTGNEVMDAISYGRIVVISVEMFQSRAWRLFIGRIDESKEVELGLGRHSRSPTGGQQGGRGGRAPTSLVEAIVDTPSQTASVDMQSSISQSVYSDGDSGPVMSSPIMQHLLPISSAVKINVAQSVRPSATSAGGGADAGGGSGRGGGGGGVGATRHLFGRDSFNAAARGSNGLLGNMISSDDEDEDALDLLITSRGSMYSSPINPSLGRLRLPWWYVSSTDGSIRQWLVRLCTQLKWCLWRSVVIKVRNIYSVLFMWLYASVFIPVGVMLTFSDVAYTQHGFTNRLGLLTVLPLALTLTLNLCFDDQMRDRNITAWDRNRSTYCPAFSMAANTIADIVLVKSLPTLIAAALLYYPSGLTRSWPAFWTFTEGLFSLCLTASCFSRFTFGHMAALSCRFKHVRASLQFASVMLLMIVYSGIMVYLPSVPTSSSFLQEWSLFYWGCNVLYYNDMGESTFTIKGHAGQDVTTTGAELLKSVGIEDLGQNRCITVLLQQCNAYLWLGLGLALLFYRDWSRRNIFSDSFHWLVAASLKQMR